MDINHFINLFDDIKARHLERKAHYDDVLSRIECLHIWIDHLGDDLACEVWEFTRGRNEELVTDDEEGEEWKEERDV